MTITLFLQKETLLRDIQTLNNIFQYQNNVEMIEKLKIHYEPLNLCSENDETKNKVSIQVSPIELSLIGIFTGGYI